ncbi:hypothetical protein KCP70_09235 [Salmonella enterica subsp. enterica]|nr:hypothetical protein KCP70_09235 [Salmonella enterica subsp. enterica]
MHILALYKEEILRATAYRAYSCLARRRRRSYYGEEHHFAINKVAEAV